jgi:hypothetical protein
VQVDLPLTHNLLALVVGARRPSVTAAARSLSEAGRIEARPRSRWILKGEAPLELRELHRLAARQDRPISFELAHHGGGEQAESGSAR